MQPTFASPFYRVTAKALIFDESGRLLVLKNDNGNPELPGGGWEHHESFDVCLHREIQEELGAEVVSVGNVLFMYRGHNVPRGFRTLRIAAPVVVSSQEFSLGDDIQEAKFVDKDEFMGLNLMVDEGDIEKYIDLIWPTG
jgi:8-oxo-dGTP pyrophosphatase MutT (NUDIX family)